MPASHLQPFRFSISVVLHDSTTHSSAQTDAGISPMHASCSEHEHREKPTDIREHLSPPPPSSGPLWAVASVAVGASGCCYGAKHPSSPQQASPTGFACAYHATCRHDPASWLPQVLTEDRRRRTRNSSFQQQSKKQLEGRAWLNRIINFILIC